MMRPVLAIGAAACFIIALVRMATSVTSYAVLGTTGSCGNVWSFWSGDLNQASATTKSLCLGPLHSAATEAILLAVAGLVLGALAGASGHKRYHGQARYSATSESLHGRYHGKARCSCGHLRREHPDDSACVACRHLRQSCPGYAETLDPLP
jgi:hypothetical protein